MERRCKFLECFPAFAYNGGMLTPKDESRTKLIFATYNFRLWGTL